MNEYFNQVLVMHVCILQLKHIKIVTCLHILFIILHCLIFVHSLFTQPHSELVITPQHVLKINLTNHNWSKYTFNIRPVGLFLKLLMKGQELGDKLLVSSESFSGYQHGYSDHRPAVGGIFLSWCLLVPQKNVTRSFCVSRSLPSYRTNCVYTTYCEDEGGRCLETRFMG